MNDSYYVTDRRTYIDEVCFLCITVYQHVSVASAAIIRLSYKSTSDTRVQAIDKQLHKMSSWNHPIS